MELMYAGVVERIRQERAAEKRVKEEAEAAEKAKREEVLRRRPDVMLEDVVATIAKKTYNDLKADDDEEPMETDDSATTDVQSPMEKTTELANALTKNGRGPASGPGAAKKKAEPKPKPQPKKQPEQQKKEVKKGNGKGAGRGGTGPAKGSGKGGAKAEATWNAGRDLRGWVEKRRGPDTGPRNAWHRMPNGRSYVWHCGATLGEPQEEQKRTGRISRYACSRICSETCRRAMSSGSSSTATTWRPLGSTTHL